MKASYHFAFRWKEELVASVPGGKFVIGAPMGVLSVDLPDEPTWERSAPQWAKGRWDEVRSALQEWCAKDKIPLYITEGAWIAFE